MTQYLVGAKRAELVKRVCARYADGLTIRQVAAEIGYSYCATRNILVRAGVRLRPRNSGQRSKAAQASAAPEAA